MGDWIFSVTIALYIYPYKYRYYEKLKKRKKAESVKRTSQRGNDGLMVNQYLSIVKGKGKPTQRLKVVKNRRSG